MIYTTCIIFFYGTITVVMLQLLLGIIIQIELLVTLYSVSIYCYILLASQCQLVLLKIMIIIIHLLYNAWQSTETQVLYYTQYKVSSVKLDHHSIIFINSNNTGVCAFQTNYIKLIIIIIYKYIIVINSLICAANTSYLAYVIMCYQLSFKDYKEDDTPSLSNFVVSISHFLLLFTCVLL